MSISAVVLSNNSENYLDDCLSSLSFCNEIIVLDDYSKDKSREIANKYGCSVYKRKLNNNWSDQRNYGISKSSSDWVLFVDSDEIVSKQLATEIIQKTNNKSINGFYLKRLNIFFNREIRTTEMSDVKLLRLGKKGKGLWKRKVHEIWDIAGEKGQLDNLLVHKINQTNTEFIDKINLYSTVHSIENLKENKNSNVFIILFFPLIKFINNYLFKFGYKQKDIGFLISAYMSFHSFLAWSKMYLRQKKLQ